MAIENGGTPMYMPVAPAYGGGGFGGGFGMDGGWAWFLLVLLAFGGGWGGGGFGMDGGLYPLMNNSQNINDGFRDQLLSTNISGIQNSISNGFSGLQAQLSSNEIASLNRSFDSQSALTQGFFGLQSQLSQCCCDNRLATCQTQNLVATEGAATRAAIQAQTQAILDKMCQDKIDAKNELIVGLNNKINSLEANNYIQNALTAQTQYFLAQYPPTATPATR